MCYCILLSWQVWCPLGLTWIPRWQHRVSLLLYFYIYLFLPSLPQAAWMDTNKLMQIWIVPVYSCRAAAEPVKNSRVMQRWKHDFGAFKIHIATKTGCSSFIVKKIQHLFIFNVLFKTQRPTLRGCQLFCILHCYYRWKLVLTYWFGARLVICSANAACVWWSNHKTNSNLKCNFKRQQSWKHHDT